MSIPAPIVSVRPRVGPTELQYYWSPASSWVAVGFNVGATICIAKSTDGLTWIESTNNPFLLGSGNKVAWNGSYWVAVGTDTFALVCIAKSTDGMTWTDSSNNPFSGGTGNGIAWNGSYWVAVGGNTGSTVCIAKSTDGMTWTDASNNLFSGVAGNGIAWNGSYWVAVGVNTGATVCIAKSTDGMTWTDASNNPFSGGTGYGIAWNGSYWVAVGNNGANTVCIAKSTDGMTWTNSTNNPFSGGQGNGIAWNGSYWVTVGGNVTSTVSIAKSTDGLTWTNADNPFSGNSGRGISWNGNYWIAVGTNSSSSNSIAQSTDGITWTSSTNPFTGGVGLGIAGIPIVGFVLESVSPSVSVSLGPTELTKTITGLTTDTNYSFTVKTDISGSYSAAAAFRTVRTSAKPQPVSTLTKSQSIVNGELSVTFSWTNPGDYAYFYVLGLRAAGGSKDIIFRGTSDYATLSYTFTGLDATRAYTFTVQRGNDAGYSSKTSITTTATAVFNPTTVAGIRLWLDAADVSGNGSVVTDTTVVGTWYDKSGTANNGTASAGATLQTDSIGRYLDFQGSSWYDLSASSWAYGEYYTIFIVDKPLDYDANYSLMGHQSASTDSFYIQYNTTDGIRLSSQGDNVALGDTFEGLTSPVNIWCFSNYGGKTAYWNRLVSGKNTVVNSYIVDSQLSIGAKEGGSEPYSGKLREVLIYTGVMSETNREAVTTYLYNKWFTQPTLIPLIPAENSTVLWLDAADITTFFEDLSGTIPVPPGFVKGIALWKDKSGFGNDMPVPELAQYNPDIDNTGLPGFVLNNDLAQTTNYLQTGDASLFLVGWTQGGITDYFFKHDSSVNFGLNYNGTGVSWGESATTNNNQFPYVSGKYLFYGRMRKGQLISGTFINDGNIYTSYAVDTLVLPVATAPITLSHSENVAYFEVIYYNRVLTDSEMQQNAAYLSNKWYIPIPSPTLSPPAPSLKLWLDSSDPCTVFTSGDIVISWKDRVSSITAVPYGAPTLNNGIVFDGSGQYFSLPIGTLPTSAYSYYIVADVSGNSSIIHGGSKDISGQIDIKTSAGYAQTIFDDGITVSSLTDTNAIPANTTVIIESIYNNTGKSLFLSGLTGATDSSLLVQDASNNFIGYDLSGNYMNGTIKEILVYQAAHTTTERKQVETYLKNKWYPLSYLPTGTNLWLDAAASNLSLAGVNVQSWNDKSGLANDFTQSAAWAQPIYSLDPVTGRYGVQFGANGIANGLESTTTPFGATSSWSVFTVHRYDFSTSVAGELVNNNICTVYDISGNDPAAFNIGTTNTATPSTLELQFTADTNLDTATVEIHKIPVLTSQVINSLAYSNFANGTAVASHTLTQAMTDAAKLHIGFTGTLTPALAGAMRGYIYEIIVFNTTISNEDKQKVEGYLAWKWGIQGSLPTAHPYYLAPP
jgi:hypothetical protein